jgi:hypothetical protein
LVGAAGFEPTTPSLADNQLLLNAGWNEQLLKIELGDLQLGGFDLRLVGFGEDEIGKLRLNF